jgi:hypothetical protein
VIFDVRKLSGCLPIYASHDRKIIGLEEVVQSIRIRTSRTTKNRL